MIQEIYNKLLKLFVDKNIDYKIQYNDRGDKYIIDESISEKYLVFYSIIDGYYSTYIKLYVNNKEPYGDVETTLSIYPLNLFLLLRLFKDEQN